MTQDEQQHTAQKQAEAPTRKLSVLPWIAGALLLLGLAVLAGFYWSRTATVQQLRFEGNHFVSSKELERKAEIPMGVKPDSLNFLAIMNRVEQIPYVKQASIKVEPGGELIVRITERQPIALLSDGSHKIYVDEDGIRLPIIPGKIVDVPILYGFRAIPLTDTLTSSAFKAAQHFLTDVQHRPVSDATISEVAWTPDEGVVALTNENGVKLIFGKSDFNERLRNWEAFFSKIVKVKGIERMRSVDLRFKGQVVTKES